MNIYKVEYVTSWGDSKYTEEDSKRVSAKDAEAAIEKVKAKVLKEIFKDEDGTITKRDYFKLKAVNFVADFEK